jgi:hypothetical protein
MQCPKCRHQRPLNDHLTHPDICPACGIVYSKYIARQTQLPVDKSNHKTSTQNLINWRQKFWQKISYIPENISQEKYWARVCLLVCFGIWGVLFIVGGVNWEKIGSSFLHNVNLPFHEFGHILFIPFGEFMMILGGSLFQIIVPLICTLVFIFKQRDNFAASICWWWVGQNFIDVSPYIADAKERVLPLIGGLGEESHDWGNLLRMTHSLDHTQFIANTSFFIGSVIILSSIYWGGWILFSVKQKNTFMIND